MQESALLGLPLAALALRQATPLVLAGLGGICSERAGIVNIALEGMMLLSAFAGIWMAQSGGAWQGMAAAVLVGAGLGLLHVLLTQRFRVNHIVSGVAINLLALNASTYLLRTLFNHARPPREAVVKDPLDPGLFLWLALIAPLLLHAALYHTRIGLRLRAVGESPESAIMAGVAPMRMRVLGVVCSGALAGLAGGALALAFVGRYTDDMISGRGFIALAAVICGRWTPLGTLLAALGFGLMDALQLQLQGTVRLPGEFLRMLPYVFTILAALALRPQPPAALGRNDEEE